MAHIETADTIMCQRLAEPNAQVYQENYGLEFVTPSADQLGSFSRLCDTLSQERQALDGLYTDLGIVMSKRAVVYEPAAFLASPLTQQQAEAINSRETSQVAEYCVGVQSQLERIPIQESGEHLVDLKDWFAAHEVPATFSDVPFHAACGDWAGKQRVFWARASVAGRLMVMGKILQSVGTQLHFEDAFRPVGVQEGLFRRRVAWTIRDHNDWDMDQVITEAQSKTAVKPKLASHKGGAAIDARLRHTQTGDILDFGHNYPDGGALVFPRTPFVTYQQWHNRQLFQAAAGLSGLTLYVGEDWHVSYGDNLDSLDEHGHVRQGYVAQFGPIKDFDPSTGEVTAIYRPQEADQVFDYQRNIS